MKSFRQVRQEGLHLHDGKRVGEVGTNVYYEHGKLIFYHLEEEDWAKVDCPNTLSELAEALKEVKKCAYNKSEHWHQAIDSTISHIKGLTTSNL